MTRPVVVTIRPEPGCTATIRAGEALGLTMLGAPLSVVHPIDWQAPPVETIDALLLGSANAVRHAGPQLGLFQRKPVHCVGESTARTARGAGFQVASIGEGGLQGVLDAVPAGHLLRLAAADHVALTEPAGVTIDLRIVYAGEPCPLASDVAETLRTGAIVLLHSATMASHFAAECDRCGVARAMVTLASLGPRIAAAAGGGWAASAIAERPDDAALLALAADLCHDRDRPGAR